MEFKILSIIGDIKERTNIDITVFNMLGESVATTLPQDGHKYISVPLEKFSDHIFADKEAGVCCFLFNSHYNMYMGMINGADKSAQNYAYMISVLIENALSQNEENYDKEQCLTMILKGEMTIAKIKRAVKKFPMLNSPCFVIALTCAPDKINEVMSFLEQLAGDGEDKAVLTNEDTAAFVRYIETENDYQSSVDFAEMLYGNIEQELSLKVKIGVGSRAKNACELADAYNQATNAIKMGLITNSKGSIFSYKEFIMMRMIEEIPEISLRKYLDILLDSGAKEILSDPEMLNTAEEFLVNSLNISETSRLLYMHRNTLMYRLDKIEKTMGLNIRRFSDAVTFRLLLILYRHIKNL